MSNDGQFSRCHCRGEALDGVVRLVNPHQQRRRRPDCSLKVARMGPVGGSDLAQHRSRAGHDLGEAECAADLDQFAARDRHLPPQREGVQDQQHRRGIVVDNGRRLGAGYFAQQARHVFVALAAPARGKIEFQGGSGRECLRRCGSGLARQRRATEIGMQHCTGQVEHRSLGCGETLNQSVGRGVQDDGRQQPETRELHGGTPARRAMRPWSPAARTGRTTARPPACAAARRARAAGWQSPA